MWLALLHLNEGERVAVQTGIRVVARTASRGRVIGLALVVLEGAARVALLLQLTDARLTTAHAQAHVRLLAALAQLQLQVDAGRQLSRTVAEHLVDDARTALDSVQQSGVALVLVRLRTVRICVANGRAHTFQNRAETKGGSMESAT